MTEIYMLNDTAGTYKIKIVADSTTPMDLGTDSNPLKTPKKIALDSLDTAVFMNAGLAKIHFYKTLVDYQNNNVLFTLSNGGYDPYRTIRTHMTAMNLIEAQEPLQDLYMSFTLDDILDPANPGHLIELAVLKSINDMNASTRESVVEMITSALSLVGDNSGNQSTINGFLQQAKQELEGITGGVSTNIVTEDHGYNV